MKTIAALLGLVLSITTIAQADESAPARRRGLGCQIAIDGGDAYLTVLGTVADGVKRYRTPKMSEMMDWMNTNPGLFEELNAQRESGKVKTYLKGEAGWRWFFFNSQPRRDQKSPRCASRFANGYDCFDYMIKQGRSRNADGSHNEWRLSEGINSEFWLFSKAEDSARLESIARKMNCVQIRREQAPAAASEQPAAPAPEAAPEAPAAPAPSSAGNNPPPPTRVSDVLPSNDPNVDASVGTRRPSPMTLTAAPAAAAAPARSAASN